jgi:Na+/H+-dicarboxylate symporter
MNRVFTAFVMGAMVLGILAGWLINIGLSAETARTVADNLSIVTDVILRLIKKIIAPLVISTRVAGIGPVADGGGDRRRPGA